MKTTYDEKNVSRGRTVGRSGRQDLREVRNEGISRPSDDAVAKGAPYCGYPTRERTSSQAVN